MEGIERAVMHGARAGRLRAFVRQNGNGLAALADQESAAATRALNGMIGEAARVTRRAASPFAAGRG